MVCVRGQQDRLDAVSGTEVEGALAAPAHGQVGEGDGRSVHAGDVIRVGLRGAGVVGGDQELVVRDEARGPVDDVPVADEEAGGREMLPQLAADVRLDLRTGDGDPEQEEPKQHGELVRVAEPSQVRRQLGRARQELVAGREPLLDPRRLVPRLPQQPRQLDGRSRALCLGRVWAAGRRDAADGLHGCAADRRQNVLCVFRSYLNATADPSDPSDFCGLYSTSIFANANDTESVGTGVSSVPVVWNELTRTSRNLKVR